MKEKNQNSITLKTRAKKISKLLFQKRIETKESFDNDIKIKTVVYLILAGVSALLTVLNIVTKKALPMTITTGVLILVCLICLLIVVKFKNRIVPEILLAVCISGIFTYYAISGQNEGFAILWILLVPSVGMLLLSFKVGLIVSIYFMLFSIALFYTPLKTMIPGKDFYNPTFMMRFPLLYLADFLTSIVLAGQKVYYLNKSQSYSLFDPMTDLKNRRYFNELFIQYEDKSKIDFDLTIISFDLNNLKQINDKFGHFKGDEAITTMAKLLKEVFEKKTDGIYRTGGDEFVVVYRDSDDTVEDCLKEFDERIEKEVYSDYSLSASYGYVKGRDYIDSGFIDLVSIAEKNMYLNKEAYYKKNKVHRYRGQFDDFD